MIKIFFATRYRGVYKHLFNSVHIKAKFLYKKSNVFETESKFSKILICIWKSKLFDYLGIIRNTKCNYECDIYGSMNHFLDVHKPYFISVENPTALYHYRLARKNSFLGKRRINLLINSPYLKALVFWSHACADTFEEVCAKIPDNCIQRVIYPYIPANQYATNKIIEEKSENTELKLLFIAQGKRFTSKGALEIIEAFTNLQTKKYNISLTIITSINEVSDQLINYIKQIDKIKLYNFSFSYTEMEKIYAEHNILIQVTSNDSFGFTILEAMKGGNAILASNLYAIPELVKENENGFLTDPSYRYFNKNNLPNPDIWNDYKKQKKYSNTKCLRIISFLEEKIELLYNNRDILKRMSLKSLEIANNSPFDEITISQQWNDLLSHIKCYNNNK